LGLLSLGAAGLGAAGLGAAGLEAAGLGAGLATLAAGLAAFAALGASAAFLATTFLAILVREYEMANESKKKKNERTEIPENLEKKMRWRNKMQEDTRSVPSGLALAGISWGWRCREEGKKRRSKSLKASLCHFFVQPPCCVWDFGEKQQQQRQQRSETGVETVVDTLGLEENKYSLFLTSFSFFFFFFFSFFGENLYKMKLPVDGGFVWLGDSE
jgi:hypothetical protein